MINTPMSFGGMVTAPHHLAAQAGRDVLNEGGNAVEAMVASAAAIAAAYPHMNSIGGDGFWLIHEPGQEPVAIDACGAAGSQATLAFYRGHDVAQIPARGPLAANTVAGTISGWQAALEVSSRWGGRMPVSRLLQPAIELARSGIAVTQSQHELTGAKLDELAEVPGFAQTFLADGQVPVTGTRFLQPRLAETLQRLADAGLDDFYRGDLARSFARDLEAVGSPVRLSDLEGHRALGVLPLKTRLQHGTAYNLPPPTQGLASLLILAVAEQCGVAGLSGANYLHCMVEATKQAFLVRDRHVQDPAMMPEPAESFLGAAKVAAMAARVDPERALPWPASGPPADTIWMASADREGRMVSFIQSIYWEFGSGVVLEETGVHWQNRGSSFVLQDGARNALAPGRRPFHTLNPALAVLDDGRTLAYGTMGGEGQPQTQSALYTRYLHRQCTLQEAVSSPRWLLGRTWGDESTTLKLEDRFEDALFEQLERRGHVVERVQGFDPVMGHAGAIVHHPDGLLAGATDPRAEGVVASL